MTCEHPAARYGMAAREPGRYLLLIAEGAKKYAKGRPTS